MKIAEFRNGLKVAALAHDLKGNRLMEKYIYYIYLFIYLPGTVQQNIATVGADVMYIRIFIEPHMNKTMFDNGNEQGTSNLLVNFCISIYLCILNMCTGQCSLYFKCATQTKLDLQSLFV